MTEEQASRITGEVMASLKLAEDRREDAGRLVKHIGNMILIRCNRDDIPGLLEPVIARMAEDIIREGAGAAQDGGDSRAAASITRGDTAITYRDDTAITQAASRTMKDYEAQIRRFKKMNLPK